MARYLVIFFLYRLLSCSASDMECCPRDAEVVLTSDQLLVGRERLSDTCAEASTSNKARALIADALLLSIASW